MGLFDAVLDPIFGGTPQAQSPFPNARELGGAFQQFLLNRLLTPTTETEAFKTGAAAIRDAIGASTKVQKQAFGDRAVTGGFLDSGIVDEGLLSIDRSGQANLTNQLNELFLALELSKDEGILGFLSGQAGISTANAQLEAARQAQLMDIFLKTPIETAGQIAAAAAGKGPIG